jgi:hypothetical protein
MTRPIRSSRRSNLASKTHAAPSRCCAFPPSRWCGL